MRLTNVITRIDRSVLFLIRFYQKTIAVWLPPSCRFAPSCSEYAFAAVQSFGALRGLWLGAKRILRCHPWHPGGFDPLKLPCVKTKEPKSDFRIMHAGHMAHDALRNKGKA